jgi:hypothetical protein
MKKDFIDYTPQELNTFLKDRCDIDLFQLSSLALEIFRWKRIFPEIKVPPEGILKFTGPQNDPWDEPQYCLHISTSEYIHPQILLSQKKQVINLEKKIFGVMLNFETTVFKYKKPSSEEINSDEFKKFFLFRYGLEKFFGYLDYYKSLIDELLGQKRIGKPINRRNLLCACWALYFYEKKKTVSWILLADLLEWFWHKIEPYDFYHDFKPSHGQVDPGYLKNQFYKQKKRWIKHYDAIRPCVFMDKDIGGARIIVFGRNIYDLGGTFAYKIELSLRGISKLPNNELWEKVHKIYSTRAKFKRPKNAREDINTTTESIKFAKKAKINWMVVFPDGSYAIDPE